MKANEILDELDKMFPNAHCELNYQTPFQLAVAVVLSAQTTDAAVNRVTPVLFEKYPDAYAMASAEIPDLEQCIRTIGLYRNKAKNIQGLAKGIVEIYGGVMPRTMDELIVLPGVGRKSANVIMSECFQVPAIAVDTHVERVSKRLGLAKKEDSVLKVEEKLMKKIKKDRWSHAHHLLIFFGRYCCKAKNPMCGECPFHESCKEKKN